MANNNRISHEQTVKLVFAGILTAIVFALQFFGANIKFGTFSVSLVLVPIVIGAAVLGPLASSWLGLVFSVTVLLSGDAAAFLAISVPGTIITVLLKGTLAGLAAGFVFRWLNKINRYLAVIVAAVVCPIVNTGIFLLGCLVFFYDTVAGWGEANGFTNTFVFMIVGFVGFNFLFELGTNCILSPAILRILNAIKKDDKQDENIESDEIAI